MDTALASLDRLSASCAIHDARQMTDDARGIGGDALAASRALEDEGSLALAVRLRAAPVAAAQSVTMVRMPGWRSASGAS